MSRIHVDDIYDKEGTGAPTLPVGVSITGVATATSFSGNLTGNVTGTAATFTTVEATRYIGVTPGGTDITSCLFT